eukprot:TRINITY_DN19360_c0_g1_i1.p1 TRINITY_DN19360_c0_g1~~TRINITY_DN19360_c0_g1_i1.p1  ORF type:complete len:673 (+),score=155.68 TRINITY_DN19360_c0_g1_i1:51-2069(+)
MVAATAAQAGALRKNSSSRLPSLASLTARSGFGTARAEQPSFTVEYVGGPCRWKFVKTAPDKLDAASKLRARSSSALQGPTGKASGIGEHRPRRQKSEPVALHEATRSMGWGEKSERELKFHSVAMQLGYCPGMPRKRGMNESRLGDWLPPAYRAGTFLDLAPTAKAKLAPGGTDDARGGRSASTSASAVKIETRDQVRILTMPPDGERLMVKRFASFWTELPSKGRSHSTGSLGLNDSSVEMIPSEPVTPKGESIPQSPEKEDSKQSRQNLTGGTGLLTGLVAAKDAAKTITSRASAAPIIDVNSPASRVQQIFDRFDADRTGRLDKLELRQIFKTIGPDLSVNMIEFIMKDLDKGGDGYVTSNELLAWINDGSEAAVAAYEVIKEETGEAMAARVREVFNRFDTDGGGILDSSELKHLLHTLSPEFTTSDVSDLLKEVDKGGDGKVSLREFVAWMKADSSWARRILLAISPETGNKREERIRKAFVSYDFSGDGNIAIEELRKTLKVLGSFSTDEVKVICADLDRSKDGDISYAEFAAWVRRGTGIKEIMKAKAVLAPSSGDGLEAVFYNFCGAGYQELDSRGLLKVCMDCKLVDKKLDAAGIDLIFSDTKVKQKSKKRMDFYEFEVALELLAERKGVAKAELREAILLQGGPKHTGTKVQDVSFSNRRK